MFTNAIIYRLTAPLDLSNLQEALAEHVFMPCGSQEASRYGWVPACDADTGADGESEPRLAFPIRLNDGDGYALRALHEEKIIPSATVNRLVNEKVTAIEDAEGRKIYRAERANIKDEILLDLLPRALTKQTETHALLLPSMIIIGVTNFGRAEMLLTKLRTSLGSLPVALPDVKASPAATMTHWVAGHAPLPDGFELLDGCELTDNLVEGGSVKIKGQDLTSSEVRAHLEAGKRVSSLALEWQQHLRLTLLEDLRLQKLRQTDQCLENREDAPDDPVARFEAEQVYSALLLQRLWRDLTEALGGEVLPEAKGEAA